MKAKPQPATDEFEFTLVLGGIERERQEIEDSLFEVGCDDATLATRGDRWFLRFSRAAHSFKEAILSAITDVQRARLNAEVLRIDNCNLVTQADIARRIGRSRQLIHQYMSGSRGPGSFPAAVHEIPDGPRMWSWTEVANWLWQNNLLKESDLRQAEQLEAINSVLELEHQRRINRQLTEEVLRSVGSA